MTATASALNATAIAHASSPEATTTGLTAIRGLSRAPLKNRHKQFVIDGEAVLGVDGVADFNALHSRKHDYEVQLYAFDILAPNSEDLRGLPLSMRESNLDRLLARRLGMWLRRCSGRCRMTRLES